MVVVVVVEEAEAATVVLIDDPLLQGKEEFPGLASEDPDRGEDLGKKVASEGGLQ